MDKATANVIHSLRRAEERHGKQLSKADLDAMLQQVLRFTRCRKLRQLTLRRAVWLVQYGGGTWKLVIEQNKKRGRNSIVTVLPR